MWQNEVIEKLCWPGLSFLLNFDPLIPNLGVVLNPDGPFSHNLTSKFEKGRLQHFSEVFPQCPIDTPQNSLWVKSTSQVCDWWYPGKKNDFKNRFFGRPFLVNEPYLTYRRGKEHKTKFSENLHQNWFLKSFFRLHFSNNIPEKCFWPKKCFGVHRTPWTAFFEVWGQTVQKWSIKIPIFGEPTWIYMKIYV